MLSEPNTLSTDPPTHPMLRPSLIALATLACAGAALALVQERVQKKKADFPTAHAAALRQWEAGQYGACLGSLRELEGLVSRKRIETILAALPAAPQGFRVGDETQLQELENNPFAAMAGMVGNAVNRSYQADDASIDLTITADSPLAQMLVMWLKNPKLVDPSAEVVKYGAHSALLKGEGTDWDLQLLVDDKHLVEVKVSGKDDEFLLRFLDQAAVDRLAAVLRN